MASKTVYALVRIDRSRNYPEDVTEADIVIHLFGDPAVAQLVQDTSGGFIREIELDDRRLTSGGDNYDPLR